MKSRMRVDRVLVARGLFDSRAKAQAAVEAGLVTADGVHVAKPSDEISVDAVLLAAPAHPWVSRGGVKLAAALDHFGVDPRGRTCLDVGASTGGFTEVLIARGAKHVYAVDVGHGQLDEKIRKMSNVTSFENQDIRALDPSTFSERPAFITVDVSFVSLKQVLPSALALAQAPAWLVALIKPQFEAGRSRVKKGLVRDAAVHAEICEGIRAFVASLGWAIVGLFASPIAGGEGNREFFIGARRD
jgi:23S rRNA (cytidine1920-2'-O)/16S rRNA (cytidine1409-2'-O)-methyltransferase